jgi:uncharacterized protein (DUF488 family)
MLTIGHSTHPIAEFMDILHAHGVEMVVDVRTIPKSRHNPQFNRDSVAGSLEEAGIAYRHMPALGGLRRPRPDSPNTGWRNLSFRGYADYMQTREFGAALEELMELARRHRLAVMCAESVPWRCHRSLIADAATVRGAAVEHIMSATVRRPHVVTPFARVEDGKITYTEL